MQRVTPRAVIYAELLIEGTRSYSRLVVTECHAEVIARRANASRRCELAHAWSAGTLRNAEG